MASSASSLVIFAVFKICNIYIPTVYLRHKPTVYWASDTSPQSTGPQIQAYSLLGLRYKPTVYWLRHKPTLPEIQSPLGQKLDLPEIGRRQRVSPFTRPTETVTCHPPHSETVTCHPPLRDCHLSSTPQRLSPVARHRDCQVSF